MKAEEFVELWKNSEEYLRIFIGTMIFSSSEREDIMQNTALTAWRKIMSYDSDLASFKTWVTGIARLECLNYIRKSHSGKLLFDDELMNQTIELMQQNESMAEMKEELKYYMEKLPEDKQKLLKMKYYDNLSISEISRELDISEASIKERLYRVRNDLRQAVMKEDT